MITLGMSLEAIGEPEKAEGYYRAVLGDFTKYLDRVKKIPMAPGSQPGHLSHYA